SITLQIVNLVLNGFKPYETIGLIRVIEFNILPGGPIAWSAEASAVASPPSLFSGGLVCGTQRP
ncbi:MAG: hypothetical protein LC103_08240, partial [Anaerolineales bacterium]|nr:hypothetical protein [Anaerolineales bacterium]